MNYNKYISKRRVTIDNEDQRALGNPENKGSHSRSWSSSCSDHEESSRSRSSSRKRDYSQSPYQNRKQKIENDNDFGKSEKSNLPTEQMIRCENCGCYGDGNRELKNRCYEEEGSRLRSSRKSSKDKEDQENDTHKIHKHRSSPCRATCRGSCCRRYKRSRSRSSSLARLSFKSCDKERYHRRSPSTARTKRCSVSPYTKRRNRSPSYQNRRRSPYYKRASRSPDAIRKRFARSRSRKRSRSPYERKRNPARSRYYSDNRRSRSPSDYKRYNHSPQKTRSDLKHTERSRSPYQRHSGGYPRAHSKSPTKKLYKRPESKKENYHGLPFNYEMPPLEYPCYEAGGYWIPGPLPPRPDYMARGIIPPPMRHPHSLLHSPYILPQPFMPIIPPHHQFRPRLSTKHNRPSTSKIIAPVVTTATNTITSTSATVHKSITSVLKNSTSTGSLVKSENENT